MRVRGPKNFGRAVQTNPTWLRYASAIMEQKKCWEVVGSNVLLRTNSQQHVRGCANGRNMQQPTMLRPFAQGLSTRGDSNFPPHCDEK